MPGDVPDAKRIEKGQGAMKKMIWAAPYKPDKNALKWAAEKNIELIQHQSVAEILKLENIDARAEKLRELAGCLDAGIIVGHNK